MNRNATLLTLDRLRLAVNRVESVKRRTNADEQSESTYDAAIRRLASER